MKSVPLATFHELEPAQRLQQRLLEAGIPATINDESKLERYWFMSAPLAAIHIEVSQPDYLHARGVIAGWDKSDNILREAVRCPDCRSSRVEYPQLTRKFLTPTLLRLFMYLRIVSPEFYCLDCHFTWPTVARVERELDVLGFPRDSRFWHPENVRSNRRT